jgi:Protein of unknown function (DUF1236)
MRSKFLISTAALLAGVALASAQNMPGGGRESGGAQSPAAQGQGAQGGAAAQDRQSPQGERGKQGQAQDRAKQGGQKDQTTGQAPQKEQGAQGRDAQQDKAQPQRSQRDREQTTGQGERQQGQSPSGAQRDQSQPQGQTQQRQEGQQGQTGAAPKGQNAPNQAQKETSGGNVTLTTEQRTKIRQTVLTGNAPRATNVNFSVSVGTAVPTSVRVVAVPTILVDIHPEWRGYMYFVVGDQIIIVDRGHRIIAVLDV